MQASHQAMLASIAADALLVRLLPASGHGALMCAAAGYSSSAPPARTVDHARQGLFDHDINLSRASLLVSPRCTRSCNRLCAAATALCNAGDLPKVPSMPARSLLMRKLVQFERLLRPEEPQGPQEQATSKQQVCNV